MNASWRASAFRRASHLGLRRGGLDRRRPLVAGRDRRPSAPNRRRRLRLRTCGVSPGIGAGHRLAASKPGALSQEPARGPARSQRRPGVEAGRRGRGTFRAGPSRFRQTRGAARHPRRLARAAPSRNRSGHCGPGDRQPGSRSSPRPGSTATAANQGLNGPPSRGQKRAKAAGSWAPKLTPTQATPALAASCRSCVVSPIMRVRSGSTPNSRISSCSICGCGLERVSSAVRAGVKHAPQCHMRQGLVQALAGLAGGHAQPVLACLDVSQHLKRAFKQAELVLTGKVMVAVALPQFRVTLGRQARHGVLQGVVQTQADHIGGAAVIGHGQRPGRRRPPGCTARSGQWSHTACRPSRRQSGQNGVQRSWRRRKVSPAVSRIRLAAVRPARSAPHWQGGRRPVDGHAGTCARI